MSVMDTFKNSYVIVIPVIVFGVIMAFFDSVLSGEKRKRVDYLKLIVLLSMVTIGIIYVNKTNKIVSEDVISGVAPF